MTAQLSLSDFLDLAEAEGLLDEHPFRLRCRKPRTLKLVTEPVTRIADLFLGEDEPGEQRPKCRSECRDGPRPCPWVGCRYHLYLDVNEETGAIRYNQLDADGIPLEPWELADSCALDVAGRGPLSTADIGQFYGVGQERARQLVQSAMASAREIAGILVEDEDGE